MSAFQSFFQKIKIIMLVSALTFTVVNAAAYEIVAGPGWTATDPNFIAQKETIEDLIGIYLTPEFVNKTGVTKISLQKNELFLKGNSVGGYAQGTEIFIHVSHWLSEPEIIAKCTANNRLDERCADYQRNDFKFYKKHRIRQLFSHELFHVIDRSFTARNINAPFNERWNRLNPVGHVYEDSGSEVIGSEPHSHGAEEDPLVPAYLAHDRMSMYRPGFVTRYAYSVLAEDKAEVFGWYMATAPEMDRMAATDPILKGKINIIADMIDKLCENNGCRPPFMLRAEGGFSREVAAPATPAASSSGAGASVSPVAPASPASIVPATVEEDEGEGESEDE